MALADPQSVTVNAVAKSLARTDQGVYRTADRKYQLTIDNQVGSRYRTLAKLQFDDTVANPLVPAQNIPVSTSVHIVIDSPKNGSDSTTTGYIANALVAWLTPANVAKLITGEE